MPALAVADGDAAHPAVVQGVAVGHSGRVHMDGVVESVARVALAWSGVPQIAHACCPQQRDTKELQSRDSSGVSRGGSRLPLASVLLPCRGSRVGSKANTRR